jgi:hypothetical protein
VVEKALLLEARASCEKEGPPASLLNAMEEAIVRDSSNALEKVVEDATGEGVIGDCVGLWSRSAQEFPRHPPQFILGYALVAPWANQSNAI